MEFPNSLKQNSDDDQSVEDPNISIEVSKSKQLMSRRKFLIYAGFSAIIIAAGIKGYTSFFGSIDRELAKSLDPLFDSKFKKAAESIGSDVVNALRAKGVINRVGKINTSIVTKLARTDRVIVYKGRYYTQTELELYGLAYLVHKRDRL